jgi:hypothetical protein
VAFVGHMVFSDDRVTPGRKKLVRTTISLTVVFAGQGGCIARAQSYATFARACDDQDRGGLGI